MLTKSIKEPTYDEIRDNAVVAEDEHEVARACWYPQMGGYIGKCVVITPKQPYGGDDPPCFTALVWHDGEFPFSDGDPRGRSVVVIHHCSARQFNEFGDLVTNFQRDAALADKES